MTKVDKYPHSVEAILQHEAKRLVLSVWNMHVDGNCDDYTYRVQIMPEIWNVLNSRQKDYFAHLLGGAWLIAPMKDSLGVWLSVRREAIYEFHYHAPLRVHPTRVTNNTN